MDNRNRSIEYSDPRLLKWARNCPFVQSRPSWKKRVRRLQNVLLHRHARPAIAAIKSVFPAARWSVFFAFCPNGQLSISQRFSLERLRDIGVPLLVVAGTREPSILPLELLDLGDALYWKAIPGYDFSAYTIALEAIAAKSEGATIFFMNDSVFGPFHDIRQDAFMSPWEFTGWTACGKIQNHLQSYAFSIRTVNADRLDALRTVFFRRFVFNRAEAVIACQETRLASVAVKSMTAGSLWYPLEREVDATVALPFELLNDGFPFLKKSLLGKYRHFQDCNQVRECLLRHHHPDVAQ